jgi:PRTRC genetic system ThiF family protein
MLNVLDLSPPLRFKLPGWPLVIALVGAGGTGSHLLQNLVKIVLHARDAGLPPIKVAVIDGDTVERKNTRGRQLFGVKDVGRNKAEVLAARFNALYGLQIVAVPHMATCDILADIAPDPRREVGMLIGAVDRPSGRRTLHDALRNQPWRLWLDCGNGKDGGQVCWGTAVLKRQLHDALLVPGLCAEVPAPSRQFPALLTLGEEAPAVDCAQRIALGDQSLLINVQMAALAAAYLFKLIVEREIDHLCSTVSLDPPMLVTTMLTPAVITDVAAPGTERLRRATRRTIRRDVHRRIHHRRIQRRLGRHHEGAIR